MTGGGMDGGELDYRQKWRFRRRQSHLRRITVGIAVAAAAAAVGLIYARHSRPALREVVWRARGAENAPARLALSGDTLVAVWSHGVVQAYRAATGVELWPGGFRRSYGLEGPPLVASGTVYFGATDCYLRALSLKNGQPLASFAPFRTEAPLHTRLCSDGARLYVGTDEGRLYALDTGTGQVRWCWPPQDRRGRGPIAGAAVRWGNAVIFATGEGEVLSVNAVSGGLLWRREAGAGVYSDLSAAEDRVYFGSDDGHAYCWLAKGVDPKSEWEGWQGADGRYYLQRPGKLTLAFNAFSGMLQPAGPGPGRLSVGLLRHGITVAKGRAYFAGTKGLVCCVDAVTGKPGWVRMLPTRPTTPITVHRTALLIGCAHNQVLQLNRATGEIAASWGLDSKPLDRIWVDDERIYVATLGGEVLALPSAIEH